MQEALAVRLRPVRDVEALHHGAGLEVRASVADVRGRREPLAGAREEVPNRVHGLQTAKGQDAAREKCYTDWRMKKLTTTLCALAAAACAAAAPLPQHHV